MKTLKTKRKTKSLLALALISLLGLNMVACNANEPIVDLGAYVPADKDTRPLNEMDYLTRVNRLIIPIANYTGNLAEQSVMVRKGEISFSQAIASVEKTSELVEETYLELERLKPPVMYTDHLPEVLVCLANISGALDQYKAILMEEDVENIQGVIRIIQGQVRELQSYVKTI